MNMPLRLMLVVFLAAGAAGAQAASDTVQALTDVMQQRPDLYHGAELFKVCAVCHGSMGTGAVDGTVPRIAGQHFSVLVKQIVDYRTNHRWDPRMEYIADRHLLKTPQDIADVAGYASQMMLSGDAGIGTGTGEFLAQGREAFANLCSSCHGETGDGNALQRVPQLAGQHYNYIVRQIHDAVEGRRPNFSAAHVGLLSKLDYTGIMGVADYVSRLPRNVQPLPRGLAANPTPKGIRAPN